MTKKLNPIKYLQNDGFAITSNPAKYFKSYNPNVGPKPWGKRDLWAYGQNADSFCGGYHRAFDMSKRHKAPIKSIANALVAPGTGWNTFGWTLVLTFFDANGDHYQVIYGHLDRDPRKYLKVGQKVKKGQIVAYQGNSNNIGATNMASHLHIQFQHFETLNAKDFTCKGIDPLKINISKTHATRPPHTKTASKKTKAKKKNGKVIALDIGHGVNTFPANGKGVFKNGKGYAEFSFNNDLGKKVKKLLEHNGFTVIMAQPFDSNDVALSKRTDYYDNKKPDLGLSLHANAGNSAVQGRCVFYWFSSKQGRSFADSIVSNMKGKGYTSHGVGLHASEWGSWTNLHMVRMSTTFPMVLIEHGFMTNNSDFNLIFGSGREKYIDDMANADVKAVTDYFGYSFAALGDYVEASGPAVSGDNYYRVQVGAFSKKPNATSLRNKVNAKGYDTLLAYDNDDDLYRVQIGAFSKKSNAEAQLKKVKADGFSDAFIAGNDGHVVSFETTAPNEKLTPYTIGDWKTNEYGTQYIEARGTFTVGSQAIRTRSIGPKLLSNNKSGLAHPGFSVDYKYLCRSDGHVWIEYDLNGGTWWMPYNTWNAITGNVGSDEWGGFS